MATRRGFKIYSCDTGTCVYDDSMGAVRIVEMLFCTSLLVVVGAGDTPELSPCRLKVLNTSNHTCIADLTRQLVLAVRLNCARLVVVEERRAVVHDLSTPASSEPSTPSRTRAASARSPTTRTLPSSPSQRTPRRRRRDSRLRQPSTSRELQCHNSPLAACALTRDGAMLATASAKGTVIRVHCLPHGTKLWSFRRGSSTQTFGRCALAQSRRWTNRPGREAPGGELREGDRARVAHRGPAQGQGQRPNCGGTRRIRTGNRRFGRTGARGRSHRRRAQGGGKMVGAMLPSGLRRRVSDAVQPTRDAVTVHLPRPANDGSYLDRAIGGVASVASVVSGQGG